MFEDNDNEVVIGQVVYAFASATMAKSFELCLGTGTLGTCKEAWPPLGIYPPPILDEDIIQ